MNELAYPHAIRDIVAEYQYKTERIDDELVAYENARKHLNAQCVVTGASGAQVVQSSYPSPTIAKRTLLSSAWKALYLKLNLDRVFSTTDDKKFH